jgi:hypothetical protein
MMRIFEALAEDSFRVTRIFRIATEAEAWLVSQRSLAEHRLTGESQCSRSGVVDAGPLH